MSRYLESESLTGLWSLLSKAVVCATSLWVSAYETILAIEGKDCGVSVLLIKLIFCN